MVTVAAVAMLLAAPWPEPTRVDALEGYAAYYNPGKMERTAVNRGLIREPEEYANWLEARGLRGAVALNPAGDLGRVVWLEGPQGIEGPFLSIDCAQLAHYADRLEQRRVVDVDWATAARWGMQGPVPVTVYFRDPHLARYLSACDRPIGKVLQGVYHENGDLSVIGAY